MTWNLWWQFGPWQARQPAIEAELLLVDPDIALLQEVYCNAEGDQAERLASVTGREMARTTTPDGEPFRFGNAILSRWPILSSETVVLPDSDGEPGPRSALLVEIQTPRGCQLVVCTHLEWRYDRSSTREDQLAEICLRIKSWIERMAAGTTGTEPAPLPPLLGGDFNAVAQSDELRRVSGLAAPYVEGLVFTDAWAATNEAPGFTWTRSNEHSLDAQWPNRRVDYLFVAWPRSKPQMNPLRSQIAGVTSHQGVLPSDHYAVVAEFDDRDPYPIKPVSQTQ